MGRVIRIKDDTFKRLQELAKPFVDTPSDVVERLLDDYERRHGGRTRQLSVAPVEKAGKPAPIEQKSEHRTTQLRPSSKQMGMISRKLLAGHLEDEWGRLHLNGIRLFTDDESEQIICLYSAGSSDTEGKWFFGINVKYWESWDDDKYLALIVRDGDSCSFILFTPEESIALLNNCGQDKSGEKKINIRTPSSGKTYIQEWPDFPFEQRLTLIEDRIKNVEP